ncbi:nuclear transport factor 2 family protein [Parasalinivibrio latis]|uniref:nuclear transport factor 2 family protein n=1 Tax=Parasalinivibrio latis TaxID=2952610 RepID=UPI0030DE6C51
MDGEQSAHNSQSMDFPKSKKIPESPLNAFIELYEHLHKDNLVGIKDVYDPDVVFQDPAHQIVGLPPLLKYFEALYENLDACTFTITDTIGDDKQAFVRWTMLLSHPKLDGGKPRTVHGCTQLRFNEGKVSYHRDFFDLGEMIYEAIPVLGSVVKRIKRGLGR